MKRRNTIVAAGVCAAALAISLPVSAFAFGGQGFDGSGAAGQAAYIERAVTADEAMSEDVALEKQYLSEELSSASQTLLANAGAGVGVCGGCGTGYVDVDGDGVCDSCAGGQGGGYVDGDGDGVCDNRVAAGNGQGFRNGACQGNGGRYYTDADGDGVCDYQGSGCGGNGAYTDADGDGICDNYEATGDYGFASACGGRGAHHGGRWV